jgi:S1-C subfamily serine protease
LLRDLGARLLNDNTLIPGGEPLATRFQSLTKTFHLANQAALTGDRRQKKEALRLVRDLQGLYAEYGRRALASETAFADRQESLHRRGQLEETIQQRKADIRALGGKWVDPGKNRWRRRAGLAVLAGALLVAAGIPLYGTLRSWISPDTGKAGPGRPSLRELFARLAPSTPLVEALDNGSGSGFLVEQDGKLLVVTNRHVVEGAGQGIAVHFLKSSADKEDKITIAASRTAVVAIHQSADLALVDVTGDAQKIRDWGAIPVTLAPAAHVPQVGEHVFAIGHPGTGGAGILTRTLSDGIVSATGREVEKARFIQVTVPLNPGNSGGPLFDDEGRVVGINTFIIRKNRSSDLALEALNFALEVRFVHELLTDPAKSLDKGAIAALLKSGGSDEDSGLETELKTMVQNWTSKGFHPFGGDVRRTIRVLPMPPRTNRILGLRLMSGRMYAIGVVSRGAPNLDLAVVSLNGRILASDTKPDAHPSVSFQVPPPGTCSIHLSNPTPANALAVVVIFEK